MIPGLAACDGLPAQLVLDELFRAADDFAAGAPQHDDMTAIVVRVL